MDTSTTAIIHLPTFLSESMKNNNSLDFWLGLSVSREFSNGNKIFTKNELMKNIPVKKKRNMPKMKNTLCPLKKNRNK